MIINKRPHRGRWLTETVDDHAADHILGVGIRGGARVRADVRLGETGDDQSQIVAGSHRGGHVHAGGPAKRQ